MLDHPAGGVSFGRQGSLIALLSEQGRLQLREDLGAAVVVIGLELLGQLADRGGELLGLDTQLEEGAGALQAADRAGGSWSSPCWGRVGGSDGDWGENGHGSARQMGSAGAHGSRWLQAQKDLQGAPSAGTAVGTPRDRRMG